METTSGIDTTGFMFFFLDEADTVEALAARIIPGGEEDPGAREAGVVHYIDRALAGPYFGWQAAYREGVRTLNTYTAERYGKKLFELEEEAQDAVVGALERGEIPGFGEGSEAGDFFTTVWAHTVEGMFSDPAYGGNRDAVGWKLIGFPGAQYGYSAEEMRYGKDLSEKPLMTLGNIQKLAREKPELFYRRPGPDPSVPAEETPEMPTRPGEPEKPPGGGGA
ncbi:MAG: gluconate 2-dehydrogenase subunit 3 family protein [Actinobacteria bacterium]|nr:gluconate 2-dehydrogenase subunit 3 family protein [Actinomycetota bacterium]